MGANSSLLSPDSSDGSTHRSKLTLGEIPESCVALVLSYLDPPEICKLARLNRAFRAASSADFIWDDKLPLNYQHLVDDYLITNPRKLGKYEIYSRLTRPVRFDDGNKEFWLDKRTGGVCLSISCKALNITGIDDRRYWNFIQTNESRFHTIAYLQQIWWLEVEGDVGFKFPSGTYSVLFKLRLGRFTKRSNRRVSNYEGVHGWDIKPVQFQLSTTDGQHAVSKCYLENKGVWEYHHVGDFVVDDSFVPTKIKFSLTQIDCTHTKGGLSVDSVVICPTSLVKDFKALL
ncbi:putative phloem protein [Helianthus annuus]|uniref:Phloem protein n=1 Tax=Helianthus annuus TaxID=4232 RepID=A0A251V1Y2_HELAN|nr:F-box protein PP2-A13 [Helianthus annuus]KAF5811668.1 putative phloem protein [Helianthus annuus]KAJ0598270.1 putative phloem protein [Helianthus annuus]